ncbi:MAG: hypothetical protein HC933_23045 [Pleurocapsa sp. SU_196_0]|nr:hypothetical protein [Pleurocapsa sp. SU_196_0]
MCYTRVESDNALQGDSATRHASEGVLPHELNLHLRYNAANEPRRAVLELRRTAANTLVLRATNDGVRDSHGTVISLEPLIRDWLPGFLAHKTISSQHALEMRRIHGKPQIGMATRVDCTPQLEVTIRVDDVETLALIDENKLTGGSLEFVPLEWEYQTVEGVETQVFTRFSSDPEHCGLSVVDAPSVPGADILEVRGQLPNWAFAVVDPKVLNLEETDPERIAELRWYPHHNPVTHTVDRAQVDAATRAIETRAAVTVPDYASLTAQEIQTRARLHLERHRSSASTLDARAQRTSNGAGGTIMIGNWIRLRAKQLVLEGMEKIAALAQAKTEALTKFETQISAQPELRAQADAATLEDDATAAAVTLPRSAHQRRPTPTSAPRNSTPLWIVASTNASGRCSPNPNRHSARSPLERWQGRSSVGAGNLTAFSLRC